jgi:SpoVK/Ycf46/Vps4 family AAA+-type ATPase
MAERKSRVFLVATANEIAMLPPELVRKGRFDEIFFVDLPSEAVRQEIFSIHLKKRGQDPAQIQLQTLATATKGFSGAEIEQVIVAGLYNAKTRQGTAKTGDFLQEIALTRPLSVTMRERMEELRSWASERSVNAD